MRSPRPEDGECLEAPGRRQLLHANLTSDDGQPCGSSGPCQRLRFALYASSLGKRCSEQVKDLLGAGLEQIGMHIELRNERMGFAAGMDYHVVVAPHEFFVLSQGSQLMEQAWPARVVLVNTEPCSSPRLALLRRCFGRAQSIWDLDQASAQAHVKAGYPCDYLPLGFAAHSVLSEPVKKLPRHQGTCFFDAAERCGSYLYAPASERPIDLLFLGSPTTRREQFFAQAAAVLAKYRCYIHFSDGHAPFSGATRFMDTTTAIGLAQRSKILLCINHGNSTHFNWPMVVLAGIWQRALVITEPAPSGWPFQPGRDYVAAPLAQIPDQIDYYLSSATRLQEAQAIIDHGHQTLTQRCCLATFLPTLVGQLTRASSAGHGSGSIWTMALPQKDGLPTAPGERYGHCA